MSVKHLFLGQFYLLIAAVSEVWSVCSQVISNQITPPRLITINENNWKQSGNYGAALSWHTSGCVVVFLADWLIIGCVTFCQMFLPVSTRISR